MLAWLAFIGFWTPLSAAACEKIRVVGSDQWIPFAYTSPDQPDKPIGIAYDVVRLLGADLGVSVEIDVGIPWRRIELEMDNGTADLLAGNYWTEQRAKRWAVTRDFASDKVHVFVRKGEEFSYSSLSDLIGKAGVIPAGISLGQEFDSFKPNLDIYEVKQHTQMIEMLMKRRLDYMILPLYSGNLKIKALGYGEGISVLPTPVSVNSVHLSLSRESSCVVLLEKMNRQIERRVADGSIQAIISAYQ
ncbi:hypothetical protein BTA51_24630 [Hahella sp. CCB-MM4]|nr:hypothetical protein BTA51_24630 [Hahella sp. CCB-MM4]